MHFLLVVKRQKLWVLWTHKNQLVQKSLEVWLSPQEQYLSLSSKYFPFLLLGYSFIVSSLKEQSVACNNVQKPIYNCHLYKSKQEPIAPCVFLGFVVCLGVFFSLSRQPVLDRAEMGT